MAESLMTPAGGMQSSMPPPDNHPKFKIVPTVLDPELMTAVDEKHDKIKIKTPTSLMATAKLTDSKKRVRPSGGLGI